MERRKNKSKRIQIIIIIMWFTGLFLMIAGPMIKVIFKLYPSQEYRLIEDTEQIIFWEYYGKIAYNRGFFGLKPMKDFKQEDVEKPVEENIAEIYGNVYDISESGRYIAYYDYDSDEICFCDMENSVEKRFKVSENSIDQIEISPNEKNILYRETEYGYHGDGMTGDEYCYYRILDIETGTIITIYQGYQEWYNISW